MSQTRVKPDPLELFVRLVIKLRFYFGPELKFRMMKIPRAERDGIDVGMSPGGGGGAVESGQAAE